MESVEPADHTGPESVELNPEQRSLAFLNVVGGIAVLGSYALVPALAALGSTALLAILIAIAVRRGGPMAWVSVAGGAAFWFQTAVLDALAWPSYFPGLSVIDEVSSFWRVHMPMGVGDLTVMGWGIFLAYFVAAWLCRRASTREAENRARLATVWLCLAGLLVLLGINKQLDFQLWLNALGRQLAIAQGWHAYRFYVQLAFFILFAAAVIVGFLLLLRLARGHLKQIRLALFGTALLAVFVLVRAVSFDVLDLRVDVAGMKLHEILEAAGVVLVAFSAAIVGPAESEPREGGSQDGR